VSRPLNPADGAVLERLAGALGPEGVAAAVAICAEARVGIIPYAGGTGLVGGQISSEGPLPVVLSFERMARIRDLDLVDGVLVAEAGCVLAEVQAAARAVGRLFPLTLASEGSARIGGLLATNAGGINVLRYGNARDLCLGVEAVMADGRVLHGLKRVVKDNMGYDLRHLLIGSEGTLGLITAASLRLFPQPDKRATAWVSVASPRCCRGCRRRRGWGATGWCSSRAPTRAAARPGPGSTRRSVGRWRPASPATRWSRRARRSGRCSGGCANRSRRRIG
jgi:FAD/FMN-containing dehydrogenase